MRLVPVPEQEERTLLVLLGRAELWPPGRPIQQKDFGSGPSKAVAPNITQEKKNVSDKYRTKLQ